VQCRYDYLNHSLDLPIFNAAHSSTRYSLRTMPSSFGVGVRAQIAEATATTEVAIEIRLSLFSRI